VYDFILDNVNNRIVNMHMLEVRDY